MALQLPVPRVCPCYQPSDREVLRFSRPAQFLLPSLARPGLCASQIPTDLLRGRAQPTARKEERKANAWHPPGARLVSPREFPPPAPGPRAPAPAFRWARPARSTARISEHGWHLHLPAAHPLRGSRHPNSGSGGGGGSAAALNSLLNFDLARPLEAAQGCEFTPANITRLLRKAA